MRINGAADLPALASLRTMKSPAHLDKAIQAYEMEHLSPEDIGFMNARGIHGAPLPHTEVFSALALRIYADPSTGQGQAPAYYRLDLAAANQAAINGLNVMLEHTPADGKARLQEMVQELQDVQTKHELVPRYQMTQLLLDAKLLFAHRGIDGEASVREAIEVIDAVLLNMQSLNTATMSRQAADFLQLYTSTTKEECERHVARGRNPFPLSDAFHSATEDRTKSLDQCWELALEAARPQGRNMAEELKRILAPFARISAGPQDQAQQHGNAAPRPAPADAAAPWRQMA